MIKERADAIVLLSISLLFIFLMGISKNADYDIFFHLATGKYILETGQISHSQDPFSFTSTNPMSTTSWLAEIIFYKTHTLFGMEGLTILKAFVITLAFFALYLNMRAIVKEHSLDTCIFVLALVITAFAIRVRLFIRPFIFEFLLLALSFYILNLYRMKKENYLFLLPLFQIIWVNVHPSNITGIIVPLIVLFGEGVKYLMRWNALLDKRQLSILGLITLLVIIASLVNPMGYKALSFPFTLTGQEIYMANIDEWQPLKMEYLIGYSFRYTWGFSLLSILAVIVFLYQRGNIDLTELIIFCLFLFLAMRRMRFTAEFAIAIAPIVARGLVDMASRLSLHRIKFYKSVISGGLIAALSLIFYVSILNSKTYAFGLGSKERAFPEKAVDFLIENNIQGNMYNSLGYGGYLMWRFFPKQKVFIDGRGEVYDGIFYKDYLDAHFNSDVWKRVVDRYKIDWVILEYSRDWNRKERIAHLIDNPEWSLIYWDRVARVYAKRHSTNDHIIKKFEYKYARPNDLNPTYLNSYLSQREMAEEVIREFKRNLSINPNNEEAHLSLSYIYYSFGMRNEEFEEMKKVVEINPDIGFAHAALGEMYMQMGNLKTAEDEFIKALEIDPDDRAATAGLKRLAKK